MALFDFLRPRLAPASLAERGERAAAAYLKRKGYRIVARRSRSRLGELDLIALDGRTVVLIEVKTRRGQADDASPAEAVDLEKQRRLTRAGMAWLKAQGLLEHRARFDVVAVTWPPAKRRPMIEHLPNAFEASDESTLF